MCGGMMKKIIILVISIVLVTIGCNNISKKTDLFKVDDKDIRKLLIENEVVFLLGDEEVLYNNIDDSVTIDILNESSEFNDVFKCSLIYEKDDIHGMITLEVNFDDLNNIGEVLELSPQPFDLSYIGAFNPVELNEITKYLFNEGLYLEKNGLKATYEEDQLLTIDQSEDIVVINKDILKQGVVVKLGMNVINAETEIQVFYERSDENTWVIVQTEVEEEKTVFTSPRDLIGRWGAPYLYSGDNSFGVLVIQSYDAKTATYKAIFEPHRRISTTHISHLGYYSVKITYDLEKDQLLFKAGEWATENSSYPLFDFEMTFDDDMNLYSRPINWINETAVKFTFTQDYDTYYIFNNEALMMSTGKSSYNKKLDFQNELLNLETIRTYFNDVAEEVSIEVNGKTYTFSSDQIQTVLPMSDLSLIETDKWVQTVKLNMMIDTIDLRTIATIEYTQSSDEKWTISNLMIDDKQTTIEVQ